MCVLSIALLLCIVTYAVGVRTVSANGLVITRHPNNITVLENHRLRLFCKAEGKGEIHTQWYHNGHPLPNRSRDEEYYIKHNGVIMFMEVKLKNAGTYQCRKWNNEEEVYSYQAKVKVDGYPLVAVQTQAIFLGAASPELYAADIENTILLNHIILTLSRPVLFLSIVKRVAGAPVKFVKKLPIDRHVPFGGPVQLQCIVAGIPAPVLRWKMDEKIINSPPPAGIMISNTNITKIEFRVRSVLYITNVTKNSSFICEAVNNPKGTSTRVQRKALVVMLKSVGNKSLTPSPQNQLGGSCVQYNGSVCSDILGSKTVYMRDTISKGDNKVQQLLNDLRSVQETMDNRCMESAKKILCQHTFPECDDEDKPVPLCQESCWGVKELLCFDQWLLVMNKDDLKYNLPKCPLLPSKYNANSSCVDANLFVRKEEEVTNTCYIGTGQWYNGTVNMTKSGLACQPWALYKPHKHRRPPKVFPSLQNAENFCRNPGSEEASPWCYTLDKLVRWEQCDIPKCETPPLMSDMEEGEKPRFTLLAILIVTIVTSVGAFVMGLIGVLCYQIITQRKQVKYNSTPQEELDIDIEKLTPNMAYHKVSDSCKLNSKLETMEYPRNDIVYIRDIGQGAFGRVFKAKAPNLSKDGEDTIIAVKMLKDDASEDLQQDFSREASLMANFNHPNIVKLLGICAIGKPMCLLFEYMTRGDLNEMLRRCSPEHYIIMRPSIEIYEDIPNMDTVEQLYVCMQIASGMVYLSEHGYVHRDLATRNCLVSENLNVKIADFGLARCVHTIDYYKGSEHDAIPIRWMPLESILYNKFTAESDVWSFGILMWEVFSFALQPYFGMTHEEVIKFIKDGKVLACPDNTPKQVYDLMRLCWSRKPIHRPPFQTLHSSIKSMHDDLQKKKLKEHTISLT